MRASWFSRRANVRRSILYHLIFDAHHTPALQWCRACPRTSQDLSSNFWRRRVLPIPRPPPEEGAGEYIYIYPVHPPLSLFPPSCKCQTMPCARKGSARLAGARTRAGAGRRVHGCPRGPRVARFPVLGPASTRAGARAGKDGVGPWGISTSSAGALIVSVTVTVPPNMHDARSGPS